MLQRIFLLSFLAISGLSTNLGFANATLPLIDLDPLTYQIGSKWGKTRINPSLYKTSSRALQRAALATAHVGNATGFYLGKFNRFHVIATNHHVCSIGAQCLNTNATFPLLGKTYKITEWIGTFSEVDLTLIAIDVPATDEATFALIANNFAMTKNLALGQKLLTIGFGAAGNPNRDLMVGQDSDCIVLSGTGEYRLLKDPDTVNPSADLVWSFANGCDVSHGDSGSAMIDRETGDLVGIFWTGRVPKDPQIRNSAYLQGLITHPTEAVWQELSYAVPATKIPQAVLDYIAKRSWLTPEIKSTLLKIIGH